MTLVLNKVYYSRSMPEGRQQLVSPTMVSDMPLLTQDSPACAPLIRLFDTSTRYDRARSDVNRQIKALCVRCGLQTRCGGPGDYATRFAR